MADTRRAIVLDRPGVVEIMDVAMPKVRPIYAMVKTTAVAVHPVDPPCIDYWGGNGTIVGNDFAGVVEEVGSEVQLDIEPGARVMGFVHGCKTDSMDVVAQLFKGSEPTRALCQESGAFTDHVLAHGDIMMKIPPGMSDTDAATFGASLTVVGMALYQVLELRWPHDPYPRPIPIFINGGATASGAMAIQLAKLSGLKVITTCSPANFDYVKSLGADAWYDYHQPGWSRKIRRDFPMIGLAYETTTDADAWTRIEEIFSLSGGRAAVNYPPAPDLVTRTDITWQHAAAYTSFGQRFTLGALDIPGIPQQYDFATMWWRYASKLVWEGKLKPHRTIVREGGLKGVVQGLDDVRHQKIRGHKLVYRMDT